MISTDEPFRSNNVEVLTFHRLHIIATVRSKANV